MGALEPFERMWPQVLMPRTTIVALLCAPVGRAQSWFYWSLKHQDGETFGHYVRHYPRPLSNSLHSDAMWRKGMYGLALKKWHQLVGHLIIIPAADFYRGQAQTVEALVRAWRGRSGNEHVLQTADGLTPEQLASAGDPPRANHHSHAKLEDDVTNGNDRLELSNLYRDSNQQVYDLIAAHSRGSPEDTMTVLPHAASSAQYNPRFLEPPWNQ